MPRKKTLTLSGILIAVFAFLSTTAPAFAASKEKVLFSFTYYGKGGYQPSGGLVVDPTGNLYGTTDWGGIYDNCNYQGCGTVFRLTRSESGKWTKTVLHNFGEGTDGQIPSGGLTLDTSGNLYGTTWAGGPYDGHGTVYRLSPGANGDWTETVLYNFCDESGCLDGSGPLASPILADGNLYGTTDFGGAYNHGTVFELTPGDNGVWTESVLYSFTGGSDGANPSTALTLDASGNLYGTTMLGGDLGGCNGGCGVAFELTSAQNGAWTEIVLHSFNHNGHDGYYPSSMIFDAGGNLYGAASGGAHASSCDGNGCGAIFELMPGAGGTWTEKILYSFTAAYGAYPYGLVIDASGNLYGTALEGSKYYQCSCGVAFKLTPQANGKWAETVLHIFGRRSDGKYPSSGLVFDSAANLYGMTQEGGSNDDGGAVFEITP